MAEGDREAFEGLLHEALAVDPEERPETRLATILAQRRARWLLENVDLYFLDDPQAFGEVNR